MADNFEQRAIRMGRRYRQMIDTMPDADLVGLFAATEVELIRRGIRDKPGRGR